MRAAAQRELAQQRTADDAARMAALYGDTIGDVLLLRRRDFVVTRAAKGFLVDGRPFDLEGLRALADRQRRLEGNMSSESGTVNGDGGEACGCGKPKHHRGNCWVRRGLSGPPVKKAATARSLGQAVTARRTPTTGGGVAAKPRRVKSSAVGELAQVDKLIAAVRAEIAPLEKAIADLEAIKAVLSRRKS